MLEGGKNVGGVRGPYSRGQAQPGSFHPPFVVEPVSLGENPKEFTKQVLGDPGRGSINC